jgi:hypothetical protein
VSLEDATKISKAAGKSGADARKFITDNKLETFEITPAVQKALFELTYTSLSADTQRLATKADVVAAYGNTDWDKLDPAIQDILIDLRFRGDYTGDARAIIQKYVSANDLDGFTKVMSDKDNWKNVPADRFKRRKEFLEDALAAKKAKEKQASAQLIGQKDTAAVNNAPVIPRLANEQR